MIGIAGGSGSGKTSFIKALYGGLPEGSLALVSQDNYYHPREKQEKDRNGRENFDLPTSIDQSHFESDIQALVAGNPITKLEYTFNNDAREPESIVVNPAPIIVTEGLFIFHYEKIRSMIDLAIFIDAPNHIRLQRRIHRDLEERGYPEEVVKYQWENHVVPAEEQYLYPYKDTVDLIINNELSFDGQLSELIKKLGDILKK